jgi:hypothetical protein
MNAIKAIQAIQARQWVALASNVMTFGQGAPRFFGVSRTHALSFHFNKKVCPKNQVIQSPANSSKDPPQSGTQPATK